MLTWVLMDCKVEQVSPLLRPLLATPSFALSTVAGTARFTEGAAAAMLVVPAAPRSRIDPVVSTITEGVVMIAAIDASTLLGANPQSGAVDPIQGPPVTALVGFSLAASDKVATFCFTAQLLSIKPGWAMGSVPRTPRSDLSNT